jgi:molybdopterin-guanine dinucleotide biosynthesis protein A
VILSGGTARRLGGVDKATLEIGGRRLLDRALEAVAGAASVTVVGDSAAVDRPVRFVREEPAYGGPGAGLLAGLTATDGDPVVVLAVDLPHVTDATVARLLAAVGEHDGSVLVDASGRRQLALVVRSDAVRAVAPADPTGVPVWRLLGPLDLIEVLAAGDEARDVDTPADLDATS